MIRILNIRKALWMDVDQNIFLTNVNIVSRFIFGNTETFSLNKQHFTLEADQMMLRQITIPSLFQIRNEKFPEVR